MTTALFNARAESTDVAIGLVAGAWERACREAGRPVTEPTSVSALKAQRPGRKSGAYRLAGLERAVVAKRCHRDNALVERAVYEQVLSAIDVPSLNFFGCVDDPDARYCWLFVEDAGFGKLMETEGALVAQWLARLHTSASVLSCKVELPERGPSHYLDHLRAARVNAERFVKELDPPLAQRAPVERLLRLLDRFESRWDELCAPCEDLPRTLVHGDLARKNCRRRETADGFTVVTLDWETAGWGPPAADLTNWSRPPKKTPGGWGGTVPLDIYASFVTRSLPGVTLRQIQRQSRIGTVFRLIAAIRWASELLNVGGSVPGVAKLEWLVDALLATEAPCP